MNEIEQKLLELRAEYKQRPSPTLLLKGKVLKLGLSAPPYIPNLKRDFRKFPSKLEKMAQEVLL